MNNIVSDLEISPEIDDILFVNFSKRVDQLNELVLLHENERKETEYLIKKFCYDKKNSEKMISNLLVRLNQKDYQIDQFKNLLNDKEQELLVQRQMIKKLEFQLKNIKLN